jgi:nitroreductase
MDVLAALRARGSTRAFTQRMVPAELLEQILDAARYAPSGSNIQPWQVHAVAGDVRERLCAETVAAASGDRSTYPFAYNYYPVDWREPYLARRRACGWGLYSLLGIGRGDRSAAAAHEIRNYDLFGAPVGLFFFIDADLQPGSWLDYGMFIQSVMLAAQSLGLATCPQAAWVPFHSIVRRHLGVPEGPILVCGLALGYADPAAPINSYRPARLEVQQFAQLHGFKDRGSA